MPVALFMLLQQLPLSMMTATIAVALVVIFFVTSSDSGSLVIDTITSGGATAPPVWQRIFWAITAGLVAAVLLVAGGLTALQTAAIASALPFALVMLVICYGLWRGLQQDGRLDFQYAVRARGYSVPSFAFPEFVRQRDEETRFYRAEVVLKNGPQQEDLTGFSHDEVIHDLLRRYEKHMRLLHPAAVR